MADEIIQARLWTKVDTLENWNNNPLLLGPGELALVTNGQGVPMNMKWGDKTERKRFSDLPFAIAYDQGQFVAVTSTNLPASTAGVVRYSLVGEGTYTRAGQSDVVVPTGKIGIIVDDGATWSVSSLITLPPVPLSNVVDKNDTTKAITGKGIVDYLIANYPSNTTLGIKSYNIGDNIAPELSNSDFTDTTVWARGCLDANGNVIIPWTQYHTVKYYPIVAGTYICNIQLGSNGMAIVLYDKDRNRVKSYTNQPNTDWNIVADVDGFIKFSKLSSQASENDYCKTQQPYSGSLDDSNVVTKQYASDNLISINEPKKIEKILQPKFFKNATRQIDYSAFIDIKMTGGTEGDLKYPNGEWFDLFLTFMRIRELTTTPTTSTTVVQIAKRNPDTGTVGLNNISVSSCNYSVNLIDENGYIRVDLTPIANSGLSFSLLIDTTKLTVGVDTGLDLGDTLELNTRYLFLNKSLPPVLSENGMFLGHSVVEFENMPSVLGSDLGVTFRNAGVGGTRMAVHPDARYGELSFYKIADAIDSGDFTNVVNAINEIIPTATVPRQRRLEITRDNLANTDYSKLTMMGVLFGTNDFTNNIPIGEISLDNKDVNTFVGAMNYGISKILTKYPRIRMTFFTDVFRYVNVTTGGVEVPVDGDIYVNSLGLKGIDYVDAVIKVANLNHLPAKDWYRNSFLNKYNHSIYYSDSTHPNATGATIMGHEASAFIRSCYLF